jgi:hypothetical protein
MRKSPAANDEMPSARSSGASTPEPDPLAATAAAGSTGVMHLQQQQIAKKGTEITRFRVFARVRPFIEEELKDMKDQQMRSVVEMVGNKTVLLDPKEEWIPRAQYEFDASLWSIPLDHDLVRTFQDTDRLRHDTQLDVYNLVAKQSIESVFDGFNSCVMTYGQTGSGKTYTMIGKYQTNQACGGDGEEGIVPRVCSDLFIELEVRRKRELEKPEQERSMFRVEVNFVEIYMERVRDLLDPHLKKVKDSESKALGAGKGVSAGEDRMCEAKIRQDPTSGPFIEGVTKYQVENWKQCCTLLERGSQHRTTCATLVHQQSSRSHAIFQITILQEESVPAKDRFSRPSLRSRSGRINLVDLAGSERGGMTDYVKESATINKSLLALRRVIDQLTERQNILMDQARQEITGQAISTDRVVPQVPFRDSVLTWLLSDSIGGNARTTMIATLSPLAKNFNDTLATLVWSSKARNLVTLVKSNDAQTTVAGGMTRKTTELNAQFALQRHNVDNLRETLHEKQRYAEALESQTKVIMRQIILTKAETHKVLQESSAVTIQRAWVAHLGRREAARIDRLQSEANVALTAANTAAESASAKLEAKREETRRLEDGVRASENSEARRRDEVSALRLSEQFFHERRARVEQQHNMMRCQDGDETARCQEEIILMEESVDHLRGEIAAIRADALRTNARTADMHLQVDLRGPLTVRKTESKEASSPSPSEAETLQQKLAIAQQQKAQLQGQRDALMLQRAKAYGK